MINKAIITQTRNTQSKFLLKTWARAITVVIILTGICSVFYTNAAFAGNDVNYAARFADEDLKSAVVRGSIEDAAHAVQAGANVNQVLGYSMTLLQMAPLDKAMTHFLLSHGAKADYDSLYSAIQYGDAEIVKDLLDHGAPMKNPVCSTCVLLDNAALAGRIKILALLLQYGAAINDTDHYGRTPLHVIVSDPLITLNGAPPQDTKVAMVQYILQHGIDANIRDRNGKTALDLAKLYDEKEIAEFLRPITSVPANNDWSSELCEVAGSQSGNDIKKLQRLLRFGANPNQKNKYGFLPLHIAIGANMEDNVNVKLLLDAGADVNSREERDDKTNGYTPLHDAVDRNNPHAVWVLLKAGADPAIKDTSGLTPLALAKKKSATYHELVMSDPNYTSHSLDFPNNKEIIFLLEHTHAH